MYTQVLIPLHNLCQFTPSLSSTASMATMPKTHSMYFPQEDNTASKNNATETRRRNAHPHWYSSETCIYNSQFPPLNLPSDPFLDAVSFIFSHKHNGVSALIDSSSGSSISYSELYPFVKSMASGLNQLGVSQGDVVLILSPNSIYFPVIFLGVLYVGAVVTTMNPLSSFSEIKKQTLDCHVKLAFTVFDKIHELTTLGINTIPIPENQNTDPESTFFKLIFNNNPNFIPRPVINQQDTAAIVYSSGTTGTSKGVIITHRNFISMVELFVRFEASQYEFAGSENVYLAVLPMFHIYGLSLFVMGLLSLGSSIVVMRKFNVDEMVRAIGRYKVTHFPVVPPALVALTRAARDEKSCLMSLKQVSCGATHLSTKCLEEFTHALPHVDFIQGYGMTESTAVGSRGFNTEKIRNYFSVGLLAPNMEAKVVDWITGSSMPPGSMGELYLRGPAIMRGYLNNSEATKLTIDKDGWLHTGDIVYFDQDGYLHIFDRLKEIIKYKGFQIAPVDLETVLASHPDILDVAVTAARDEEDGEIPVAFVVRIPGSEISQAELIDYVAKQVSPHKKVRKVVFTQSIPRSPAGKILRRELRNFLPSKI